MARIDNLTNFLTDVASAIKTKKGLQTNIPASSFDTEILSLPSGGTYEQKTMTITQNGQTTLTPSAGYDAMDQVVLTINVPVGQLQPKSMSITSNGSITVLPDTGYNGFSEVSLNVNVPSGSGDVKLFETIAEMQADPNPQEGDLAVVYREETQPATESSTFDKCIFPNTVTLDEAFDDYNSGEYNAIDPVSGDFNASCELSSSSFTFNGSGDAIGTINIEYESSDGITYTRTDGGTELQEFGTTIARDAWSDQWVDAIGEFIQLEGDNYFEGLYEATSSGNTITYQLASTQLDATSSYVYGKTFYGQNGIENGTLTTNVSNSFADINAEVVYKIQQQYENMTPRVLTNSDKTINKNIYFIPAKKDGTPLLDTSSVTGMSSLFEKCVNLVTIPLLNTSAAKYMGMMFSGCTNLITIPLLDTSDVTTITHMFEKCTNLVSIPSLNTSKVNYMDKVFLNCTSLVTIPVLDTSSATNMDGMFSGCSSLSNDSLNNILQMCINATNMTSNKTLRYVGLTSTQATTCQSLSNYSAFTAAGWTTGY